MFKFHVTIAINDFRAVLIAYRGILKCGSCGCAITGERKQKPSGRKYLFYHCTDYYDKCKAKKQYYTEEGLELILDGIIKDLRVDDQIYELIRTGLKKSAEDHEETAKGEKENCLKQKKIYERRLHKLYLDRVDGVIDSNFYHMTHLEWQSELDEINQKLASFDKADKSYYDRGVLFLKYAQKICAYWKALKGDSYDEKIMKGELLKVLLAEAHLVDSSLEYQFRKPFDALVRLLGSKQNKWGDRRELNPQPQDPQSCALTKLSYDHHRKGMMNYKGF